VPSVIQIPNLLNERSQEVFKLCSVDVLDCQFPSPDIALYRYRCKDRGTRDSFSALPFQKTELLEMGNV